MRQKKFRFNFRFFLLVLILAAIVMLGFARDQYILNFTNPDKGFFLPRNHVELPVNIFQENGNQQDPRWLTFPLYVLLYAGLSSAFLLLLFKRKEALLLVFFTYGFLLSFTGILTLAYLTINKHTTIFTIAQHLKEFMLSPFITLLLIAIFYAAMKKE